MGSSICCPACGKRHPLKEELIGRLVQCRDCGHAFRIVPAAGRPGTAARPPADPPQPNPPSPRPAAGLPNEPIASGPVLPRPRPVAPRPALTGRPGPRSSARFSISIEGGAAGFVATHKLWFAVLGLMLGGSLFYGMLGIVNQAVSLVISGLIILPFGLLPLPKLGESNAGKWFALFSGAWVLVGLLVVFAVEFGAPADGGSKSSGIAFGVFALITLIVSGVMIAVMSALMNHYGFYRVAAWAYLIFQGILPAGLLLILYAATDGEFRPLEALQADQRQREIRMTFRNHASRDDAVTQWFEFAQVLEEYGLERTAIVRIHGAPAGIHPYLRDRVAQAAVFDTANPQGNREIRCETLENSCFLVLGPCKDLQALAARIDFAADVKVDEWRRTVTITADPARLPEPLKPEVDDRSHPEFFRQNLADLRCFDQARQSHALSRLARAEPKELREEIFQAIQEKLTSKDASTRVDAVKGLSVWGGKQCIPFLVRMLEDEESQVRQEARNLLVQQNDSLAIEGLAGALSGPDDEVVDCLARIGPNAEEPILARLARLDERGCVRACQALGRIGSAECLEKLNELAENRAEAVRNAAEEAIRAIVQSARNGSDRSGPPHATGTRGSAEDPIGQALAALQRGEEGCRQAASDLARAAVDPDRRGAVADALAAALRESEDPSVQCLLLDALSVWRTPDTLPDLVWCAQNKAAEVRRRALEILGTMRTDDAIQALVDCLQRDPEAASEALAAVGARAERLLLKQVHQSEGEELVNTIRVLERVGTRLSLPALARLARAGDPSVRPLAQAAVRAIESRQSGAGP